MGDVTVLVTADTRRMRQGWVTALGSGLLLCVLAAAIVLELDVRNSPTVAAATGAAGNVTQEAGRDDNRGLGPPPWARGGGEGGAPGKATASWKDAWRALTPAQRSREMASLARAHEDGMRDWARCVRAARADAEKRRACEKPWPPGLAKKQR